MRIAVIDSGVAVPHPHIGAIAGGVTIDQRGQSPIYADTLGHGTAVMAAIMEKAPGAEYFAVRVFQTSLRTRIEFLIRAIEWSIEQGAHLVNLSLGTTNPQHAERFAPLISKTLLVSPTTAIPGSMEGVIGVHEDRDCPRYEYRRISEFEFAASPYPRPIPGVSLERNLSGISFAVANMTGFLARDYEIIFNSKPRS